MLVLPSDTNFSEESTTQISLTQPLFEQALQAQDQLLSSQVYFLGT